MYIYTQKLKINTHFIALTSNTAITKLNSGVTIPVSFSAPSITDFL